ncbi:MAG: hypothetical protein HND54_06385 [Bacteroidetes bacterium]|nr:hypothetical protein [Bacteroidota bacterium]NOG57344.1 hypothetical protein [Bacteroidota bacterium]
MKKITIIVCLLFNGLGANAQEEYYNANIKTQLKDLHVMVGSWEGTGWASNPKTREKMDFTQHEDISYALDSTIIIVKGKGTSNEKIIHDAFAVISNNPNGGYFMTSFLGDGKEGKYELVGSKGNYVWKIPTPQGQVIYTMQITEETWKEVGEFEMEGKRYPFFEMNLKKINN